MRNFMVVFLTLFIAFGFGCKKADVIGPEITNFQGNTELESSISLVLGEVFEKPKQKGSITEIIKLTQSTPRTLLLMPGSPSIKALDTDNDDLSTLLNEYENDIIRQYPHLNRFKGRLLTLQINPQVSQEGINTVVFKTIPDKVVRKRGYYNGFDKEGCVIKAGKKELDNASLVIGINEDLIIDYRIKLINESFGVSDEYTQKLDQKIQKQMSTSGTTLNSIIIPEEPIIPDEPEYTSKNYTLLVKNIRINSDVDIQPFDDNPEVYYIIYGYNDDPTGLGGESIADDIAEGVTYEGVPGDVDFIHAIDIDRVSSTHKWHYNINVPICHFNYSDDYTHYGFTLLVMDADWANNDKEMVAFAHTVRDWLSKEVADQISTWIGNMIVSKVIGFVAGISIIQTILELTDIDLGDVYNSIMKWIKDNIVDIVTGYFGDAIDDNIGSINLIDPIKHLYYAPNHSVTYTEENGGVQGDVSIVLSVISNIGSSGYQLPAEYTLMGTPPYALNAQRERIIFPPGCDAPLKHWNINLSWAYDFSAGQDVQFIIERAVGSPDGDYKSIGATDFNQTSFQDRTVMDDTVYYYRVAVVYRRPFFNKVSQPYYVAVPTGNVYDDDGPLAP